MEITIKKLADELKVSKPTISKAIEILGIQDELQKIGNRFVLSESQVAAIKLQISQSEIENKSQKSQKSQSEIENTIISLLETQISILQEELTAKNAHIDALGKSLQDTTAALSAAQDALRETTTALTAAQALHAATFQQQLIDKSEPSEDIEVHVAKKHFWQRWFNKK